MMIATSHGLDDDDDWRTMARDTIDMVAGTVERAKLTGEERAAVSSTARGTWRAALDAEGCSRHRMRRLPQRRREIHLRVFMEQLEKTKCAYSQLGQLIAFAMVLATLSGDAGLEQEADRRLGSFFAGGERGRAARDFNLLRPL